MQNYVLYYFNGRSKGEFIRILFAAVGVEFEDRRIEREQWRQLKPTMPFYQVPVLEVDGVKICQTSSIGRFLAKTYGLAGKSIADQTRADMIVDCFEDAMGANYGKFVLETDEIKRREFLDKFAAEQVTASLTALEKILVANNGGDGFFVGDEITWADIRLFHFVDLLKCMHIDSTLNGFPKLKALFDRVAELPRIKDYVAKRPASQW